MISQPGLFFNQLNLFYLTKRVDVTQYLFIHVHDNKISGKFFFFLSFCLFAISWTAPAAYGDSQARGQIGTVDTGLHQSHSNAGSEPRLQATPQLKAMPDPLTH